MILQQEYPESKIEIVDSRTSGMALGLPVVRAARKAIAGMGLEEVSADLIATMGRSHIYFMAATLEYLKKGGRISGAAAALGSMLHIKPIFHVEAGRVVPVEKVRSSRAAIERILEIISADHHRIGIEDIVIHHLESEERALEMSERVKQITGLEASIVPLGPVIGVHVGPGAVGTGYILREV
jgi:DegV family protein with EDD domain